MTAASNDEGAFVDWNKCPFHSTHSWTLRSLRGWPCVGQQQCKQVVFECGDIICDLPLLAGIESRRNETRRGIIRGYIGKRLSARNPLCLSVWKFLGIHLKREILFTPKFFSAPLRRTPTGKIKYFVNTNTDVKLGWSSSCSFFFTSIPPSQAASHLDKNKQKKKPSEENFLGLNQLITKKNTPPQTHIQSKAGEPGSLSPFLTERTKSGIHTMSRRRFIILSVFLAVTFSVMSRNKDGRVAVHFGWNAGGVSYKVWICPLLEREREKKTKWLFEAFAERSKKLVSVSAALTEMTQNCKTGATVKSNCPPWSSESAKDWKQL